MKYKVGDCYSSIYGSIIIIDIYIYADNFIVIKNLDTDVKMTCTHYYLDKTYNYNQKLTDENIIKSIIE